MLSEIFHFIFAGISVSIRVMVINDIFNNISAISWRSDFLVQETEVLEGGGQQTCRNSLTNLIT